MSEREQAETGTPTQPQPAGSVPDPEDNGGDPDVQTAIGDAGDLPVEDPSTT